MLDKYLSGIHPSHYGSTSELVVDADGGGGGFWRWDAAAGGDAAVVLAHPDAVDAEYGARRPARALLAVLGLEAALRRLQQEAPAPARRHGRGGGAAISSSAPRNASVFLEHAMIENSRSSCC